MSAPFVSFCFKPIARLPGLLMSPFTAEPDPNLVEASRLARKMAFLSGFRGRVGVMLTQEGEDCLRAYLTTESVSEAEDRPWNELKATAVWPRLEADEVVDDSFVSGAGEVKTLCGFLSELFAPFPDRDDEHGGREQREIRAKWRSFMVAAARTPAVRLLKAYTDGQLGENRPLALGEWWSGRAPLWQIRYDGAFIAPRSGARYLIDWMARGLPYEARKVICRDDHPDLPILFEDDSIVIVNKPARLASVVGGREHVSAESLLSDRLGKVYVVHRLDMGTSGVLVFAKNSSVVKVLNAAFRERDVVKHYVARLEGELSESAFPQNGIIDLPLMLDWFERPKQCIFPENEGARSALTRVTFAGIEQTRSGRKTLVNLYPVTGRTHQLRLHCAHEKGLGMAIDGDPFYGREGLLNESLERRLCLHAAGLKFRHPVTKACVEVWAPPQFPNF